MDTKSDTNLVGGFLSGLSGIFKSDAKKKDSATTSEFEAVKDQLNLTLKSLKAKIVEQRAQADRQKAEATSAKAGTVVTGDREKALIKQAFEDSKRGILKEIQDLHVKLKSGIEGPKLSELRDFLLFVAEQTKHDRLGDIETRLRAAAMTALFEKSGEIAFENLNILMKVADQRWPEPHDMEKGSSEERLAAARERELSEVKEVFLASSMQAIAELVVGNVTAWKLSYPPEGSWLWKQVCLKAVAAGIQAQIIERTVTALRSEGESIRQEVSVMLKSELDSLNSAAAKSGHSIDELDKIMRAAEEALTVVVVQKVLDRAKPFLK